MKPAKMILKNVWWRSPHRLGVDVESNGSETMDADDASAVIVEAVWVKLRG